MASTRRGGLTVWRAFATAISLILTGQPPSLPPTEPYALTGGGPSIRRSRRRCRRTALPRGISETPQPGPSPVGDAAVCGLEIGSVRVLRNLRRLTTSFVIPGTAKRIATHSRSDCSDVLAGLDLARLGEWTWVLVQSRDWKPILRRVGRDPDSPAFTILDKRQTFLEEALFRPNVDREPDPLGEVSRAARPTPVCSHYP